MQGELIESILIPKSDDWIVLKTDKQSYCLRLGGVSIADKIDHSKYDVVHLPVVSKAIATAYTDDQCVFIETVDGDALHHSPNASIDSDGNTSFGIKYLPKETFTEIKAEYGQDLVEL